jgi:D-alanyl-D-alanine carboxypeptidase
MGIELMGFVWGRVAAFVARGGCVAILALAAMALLPAGPAAAAKNSRYAAIVVDSTSGDVLYEAHADSKKYPASLTKMMTLYMLFEAIERGDLGFKTTLVASKRAAQQPATNLALHTGSKLTVEEAINALIIRSANDVAVVVAETLGGTESQFAQMMTKRAHQLGMANTTFRNASGLPNKGQKSTARDLATLAMALMRDYPQYYHYFSTTRFTYNGKVYKTHNRLMLNYAGADGLKTGYINASGFNVASSAVRDGRRLVAIVLGGRTARSRDAHMADLLDRGFASNRSASATTQSPALVALVPPVKPEVPIEFAASDVDGMVTVTRDAGEYAVQVGAFSRFSPAQLAANQAVRAVPDILGNARVVVDQSSKFYRARVMGLSEADARQACKTLKALDTDCLVFKADVTLALNPE